MKLGTKIAGLNLEHPIMNAAGTCKTLEEFERFIKIPISAIMVGSITIEPREGNSGDIFYSNDVFSLNALGLPNPGMKYYEKNLPVMASMAHDAGKYLFVSIAGFGQFGYDELTEMALRAGADLIELNLGCPNIQRPNMPIPCFDGILTDKILRNVNNSTFDLVDSVRIAVKLSPMSNPFKIKKTAQMLNGHKMINVVTTSNTFPNALSYTHDGKYAISPTLEFAGMGGPALKPITLGQIKQLKSYLREDIEIIGVGGIQNGQDVADYLTTGANAIQIATAYFDRGYGVFGEILDGFINL